MTRALHVLDAGPSVTVQDMGRPGGLAQGLSRGGAQDRLALAEGAALLDQDPTCAAVELALSSARFRVQGDVTLAITGAEVAARSDDTPLPLNTTVTVQDGTILSLRAQRRGVYAYLHVDGGLDTPRLLGARATHITARLGRPVQAGDMLPLGPARQIDADRWLDVSDRLSGGTVRIVDSYQSALFPDIARARLVQTTFTPDTRSNRMGLRLSGGAGFATEGALSVLSDIIVPGDIQITGDGAPYVLLADCQTTGGYPRIATVLPCDLPTLVQATPKTPVRFQRIPLEEAVAAQAKDTARQACLRDAVTKRLRDPREMPDLLQYGLISGAITGTEWEE